MSHVALMLGRSHLITGACGFLGVVTPAAAALGHPLGPAEIACGTMVAAGAAMLPDLDHPQATVSRALGPVSFVASRLVSRMAGGHRNGTHSALAVGLVGVSANGLILSHPGNLIVPFLMCFLCVALVCRILLDAQNDITSAICAAVLSAGLIAVTPDFAWLGIAVTTGYALHLAGDALTKEGVPLLWPLNRTRFKVLAITTGGRLERGIVLACSLLVALMAWSSILAPAIDRTHGDTTPPTASTAAGPATATSAAVAATTAATATTTTARARQAAPLRASERAEAAARRARAEAARGARAARTHLPGAPARQ